MKSSIYTTKCSIYHSLSLFLSHCYNKTHTEKIVFVEHSVSTELNLVGLQVWRGAFLLADYVLAYPDLFKDQTVLELGSGVGLTSIVASYLAKEVICTGKYKCSTKVCENFKFYLLFAYFRY